MSEVHDLLGWQDTRWGMTDTEIVAAIGAENLQYVSISFNDSTYVSLKIPLVELSQFAFEVLFQMDATTRVLKQVLVRYEGDISKPDAAANTAKMLLIERFGNPTRDGTSNTWLWEFPTTTIDLSVLFFEDITNITTIRFFPTASKQPRKRPTAF